MDAAGVHSLPPTPCSYNVSSDPFHPPSDTPPSIKQVVPSIRFISSLLEQMKSTGLTYSLSLIAIVIYACYIISTQGIAGLLLSFAIGMITAAFIDTTELVVAIVILAGLATTVILRSTKKEGFEPGMGTGRGISDLVVSLEQGTYKASPRKQKVKAVYSDGAEGFADVSTNEDEDEEGEPAESTPAPRSEASNTNKQVDKDQAAVATAKAVPDDSGVAGGATQPSAATGTAPATTDGFSSQSAGLFKLGEMPSESKTGPHVDVASTMRNALSALQPDQMAAMTAESNSLLETQKNLMNMLQTMRPVLQDGRKLLDTFGGIFGSLGKGPATGGGFNLN